MFIVKMNLSVEQRGGGGGLIWLRN